MSDELYVAKDRECQRIWGQYDPEPPQRHLALEALVRTLKFIGWVLFGAALCGVASGLLRLLPPPLVDWVLGIGACVAIVYGVNLTIINGERNPSDDYL